MKKITKTIALIVALGTLAVGCQKEYVMDSTYEQVDYGTASAYNMLYIIDGVKHHTVCYSDAEYTAFIYHLLDMAEQGCVVEFFDEGRQFTTVEAKEVVQYSTADKTDAFNWASKMENSGYKIRIAYDSDKKVYNCVAWK